MSYNSSQRVSGERRPPHTGFQNSQPHRCCFPNMRFNAKVLTTLLRSQLIAHRAVQSNFPVLQAYYRADNSHHPSRKGLLLDVAGTLLYPAQPAAQIYKKFAAAHGVTLSEEEILKRYRLAYQTRPKSETWARTTLRYVGDARDFWRYIVRESTGCKSEQLFEDLYHYYETAEAWAITCGALPALQRLKDSGVKIAIVSNFDTRLKPLLKNLGLDALIDECIVSAEVGAEKPNPVIFERALEALGLNANEVVHVGDDRRNDLWGARDAGIDAWLWGTDVQSFKDLADRMLDGDERRDGDLDEHKVASHS